MKKSLVFDSIGLRVELRRIVATLVSSALFLTAGNLTWNRAVASAYSEGKLVGSFRPLFMSQTNPIAGIQAGRIYEAKTPGYVQTINGQGVYNDRLVTEIKETGPTEKDREITYIDPSSQTPMAMPAALFASQVGSDVTEKLPPVSGGNGQTGTGYNWRAWAGAEAPHIQAAPGLFTPGAGQVVTHANLVVASMPPELAGAVEASERPQTERITMAPTPPPPTVVLAQAPAPTTGATPVAGPILGMDGLAASFANADSDKAAAPATGATANASPLSNSPSRQAAGAATTPTQATEKAAGMDESGGASNQARQH